MHQDHARPSSPQRRLLLPIVRATAYDVGGCKRPISPGNIKNAPHHLHSRHVCSKYPSRCAGLEGIEYPNETFTVAFPAEPKVETTSYQAPGGRLVEARVYSVWQEGGEFKVTVADMSDTEESGGNVMAYAVFMLSRGRELKFNIPHSTRRIIGRQASIDGVDGSQTYASVFFHNRRLYQIEGTVPAGGSTADAFRFQQSFDFTDGWRRPDAPAMSVGRDNRGV
jgi:hypothetical protein